MVKKYKQGDIIYLDFGPQVGHEQKGMRPALVVSCNDYNHLKNMVVAVPITSTERRDIFCCQLTEETKTQGYVLCDQIKAIDIKTRKTKYLESVSDDTLNLVLSIIKSIFSLQDSLI